MIILLQIELNYHAQGTTANAKGSTAKICCSNENVATDA
jgi:hypothetical protein